MSTTAVDIAAEHRHGVVRTREGLLAALSAIDEEGWDGATGRALLAYVRATVVRPHVGAAGLRGLAADQAEATGWEAAWEALNASAIRRVRSPWGVLWTTARRAVLGELVADAYGTDARMAWRLARRDAQSSTDSSVPDHPADRGVHPVRPVSMTALAERGWEPPARDLVARTQLGPILTRVVELLVDVGWRQPVAESLVEAVAATADGSSKSSSAVRGWRHLAEWSGLPPWQVRRVTVLLIGAPGWPGLIERLVREGPDAIRDPAVIAAVRSTVVWWWRSPILTAQRAEAAASSAGQHVA